MKLSPEFPTVGEPNSKVLGLGCITRTSSTWVLFTTGASGSCFKDSGFLALKSQGALIVSTLWLRDKVYLGEDLGRGFAVLGGSGGVWDSGIQFCSI